MNTTERINHWENIYNSNQLNKLSWYQAKPVTSLDLIANFNLPLDAKIIDIGGGDGFLVDYLLELGYQNITVLDISESSLKRVKLRLGDKADKVKWIVEDVANFQATEKYDLWHDRATFHFLTEENEINNYHNTIENCLSKNGALIIGVFSEKGPKKCSGIAIKQYSEESLTDLFSDNFDKKYAFEVDHSTPTSFLQKFVFCGFRRK